MSSQFHEEWSAVSGRFSIEMWPLPVADRRNLVLGPLTLTTGCSPIVLVTTPPHPAAKARRMFVSDSVGGADASRKGLSNRSPVNTVPSDTDIEAPWVEAVSVAQVGEIPGDPCYLANLPRRRR